MQIQATSIRPGQKIEFDDDIWLVHSFQHRTPGKGQACMQLKVRSLTTGAGKDVRFNSNERVDLAELDERRMIYSYHDGHDYVFMDSETYEQVSFTDEDLGDTAQWLVEEMEIKVQYYKGKPIGVDIPTFIEQEITQTEPAVRGDTATNVTKTAVVQSGAEVQVPLFVNQGDHIKIDTRDGTYVERMQKA